jgi:putative transposase
MIVDYIQAHRKEFGVEPTCAVLQVAPSTYYAATSRPPSARSITDAASANLIEQVHGANYGVYGARKVMPGCVARATRSRAARSND